METQSSALAWRIPGTAEPGGLPSLGLHRVGHDGSDLAASASLQAIQRVRPLAWIISCLTQRVEWETVMCVSTLDLEHPEEQYSLVWGCFFFFTRGSASQRGPRFHSDREMVSFPDAGMLVATVTGGVALEDPQQSSEEELVTAQDSAGCLETGSVQTTVHRHTASPPPFYTPPFLVEESEVQRERVICLGPT